STPRSAKRTWLPWAAVGLVFVALISISLLLLRTAPQASRLEFALPLQQEVSHLAISPDGQMLAFVSPDDATGSDMLSVMRVGAASATVLPGTEGATYPFWSPDDAYVAFFADGKLKKVAASGGVPQAITTAVDGRGGSWGKQGIIFSPDAVGWLSFVNPDGSGFAPVTDKVFDGTKEASHRWPVFLPDGDHFLFLSGTFTDAAQSAVYLGSLSHKEKTFVVKAQSNPGYANGYFFYLDDKKSLRAVRMDLSGKVSGDAQIIADLVGYQPSTYWSAFSVSANGAVVYNPTIGAGLSVLTWYDRSGRETGHLGNMGVISNPLLSPDGTRVAVDIADAKAGNVNLWISDLKTGTSSPFTFDASEDDAAVWSRDQNWIAYRSTVSSFTQIYSKQVHGVLSPKLVFDARSSPSKIDWESDLVPNSWSLDSKEILCTMQPVAASSYLALIPTEGGKLTPFLKTAFSTTNGEISPDGKWVAYASNESGDWEVYVTTFPGAAGKWQVSRGGGAEPRWRADGKEIFYIGPKSTITAAPVSTAEGTFASGNPVPLFQTQLRAPVSSSDLFTYDVTKDGQRFLVNRYTRPPNVTPVRIVLNSTASLQK
ncbi:MAG TPA: hypothetical protein VKB21_05750, partial [Candidatus Acidoferrum sp.]|nr:hypothetical protein [Candidatus Acidoferrum sp.]